MSNGTASWDCFSASVTGAVGVERYPKYVMAKNEETYCKTCGAYKDLNVTDLYEVYYDEWGNTVRKSDNKIIEETIYYKNYKPYLEAAGKLPSSDVAVNPDGSDQIVIDNDFILADNDLSDAEVIEDTVVSDDTDSIENIVVSDNTANDITDLETGGDIDFDADEDVDDDGVLVIEDDDDIVIEDE